jgi:hypothetical protein
MLNVGTTTMDKKYMGLPTSMGRMNKEKFKTLKDCLAKRFSNSAENYMSMGAKELLIYYNYINEIS